MNQRLLGELVSLRDPDYSEGDKSKSLCRLHKNGTQLPIHVDGALGCLEEWTRGGRDWRR